MTPSWLYGETDRDIIKTGTRINYWNSAALRINNYSEKAGFLKLNKKLINQMLTPLMHTCVCLLQSVKFGLGSEAGQRAVMPLHIPSFAQSESSRHFSVFDLNVHCAVQQGP